MGNHHGDDGRETTKCIGKEEEEIVCSVLEAYAVCWVLEGMRREGCMRFEGKGWRGVGFKEGNFVISTYLLGAGRNLLGVGRKSPFPSTLGSDIEA